MFTYDLKCSLFKSFLYDDIKLCTCQSESWGHPQADPRYSDREKVYWSESSNCHELSCQNLLQKDLYFYHLLCQNYVRVISERTAVVRVPCMVRHTPVNPWAACPPHHWIHFHRCIKASFCVCCLIFLKFSNKSHIMKALIILSHAGSPFFLLIYLYGEIKHL